MFGRKKELNEFDIRQINRRKNLARDYFESGVPLDSDFVEYAGPDFVQEMLNDPVLVAQRENWIAIKLEDQLKEKKNKIAQDEKRRIEALKEKASAADRTKSARERQEAARVELARLSGLGDGNV